MTPPPLPSDLQHMENAWRAGIASHTAGFQEKSNPWDGIAHHREHLRELRLLGW